MIGLDGKDLFYMGTFDRDLIDKTFGQIVSVGFASKSTSETKVRSVNAALASIIEIDPQDSTELMLAAQMVTVHNVSMEMARRALLSEQTLEGVNLNINFMTKLMRTYTAQIEALTKYRNKGKQQITVKQRNVNVNDGGQAVIGDVNQGGVMIKWKGPPHDEIPRCGARKRSGGLCGHYSMKNGRLSLSWW